ncbi:hypothetical protein AVEN_156648-1 [Araneus ventricosus]|uniref:Uncharacterized protein n=1 Tax=Araneus ventricosus TaxID=182803 RepID=A0A4Y2KIM1_ARAVE|nr:hypothetical protein AVEN_156648-1 [Araneus ventricosus]
MYTSEDRIQFPRIRRLSHFVAKVAKSLFPKAEIRFLQRFSCDVTPCWKEELVLLRRGITLNGVFEHLLAVRFQTFSLESCLTSELMSCRRRASYCSKHIAIVSDLHLLVSLICKCCFSASTLRVFQQNKVSFNYPASWSVFPS